VHVFKLFPDAGKFYGYVLGRDPYDGANLIVRQILQPEQDDGSVERFQLVDAVIKHLDLFGFLVLLFIQVDVDSQRNRVPLSFLAVERNTSIQTHLVDPGFQFAPVFEAAESLPEVNRYLLIHILYFLLIFREHETYRVDGCPVVMQQLYEGGFFLSFLFHCFAF
jgi:hypothetical protein